LRQTRQRNDKLTALAETIADSLDVAAMRFDQALAER
jgi:hypothetical protein